MSNISITVAEQKLYVTNAPLIAAQGVNEDCLLLTFDESWDGFGKVALFYRADDEATVYESAVAADGKALIPQEVTAAEGKICIGICGSNGDTIYTTEIIQYKIVKGLYTAGEASPPPAGIYEQMLQVAGQMQELYTILQRQLNQAINAQRVRINELIDGSRPGAITTLWTGSINRVNAAASLSKAVSNFDYLDIYTSDRNGATRVPASQSSAQIWGTNLSDDASNNFLQVFELGLSISGSTVRITKNVFWTWSPPSSVPIVVSDSSSASAITRIDGVKIHTDTDPEVQDVRIGYDSTVYESAGDAVRAQAFTGTDTTLAISGKAADAEATGDAISGLKSDINNASVDLYPNTAIAHDDLTFVIGSISVDTGANVNSGTIYNQNIRTNDYFEINNNFQIRLPLDTYNYSVFFYTGAASSSYVNQSGFKAGNQIFNNLQYPVYIRLRVRRVDQAVMTDADINAIQNNISVWYPIEQAEIDTTLSQPGIAADAERTGSKITEVNNIIGNPAATGYYVDDPIIIKPYATGGAQGVFGNQISFSTSSAYKHIGIDCSKYKSWKIKTRRSTSSTYPSYITETDDNNKITAMHLGVATSTYDVHEYIFTAAENSTRLYVTVCLAGGVSYDATITYIPDIARIIGAQKIDVDKIKYNEALEYDSLEQGLLTTAKQKILNINRAAGTKCLNFVFCTDVHINGYGATATYAKPSLDLFVKACNAKFADFAAFGGDMYSNYNLSHDVAIGIMGDALQHMAKIDIPLLITKGNHECNGKYIPVWEGGTPEWNTYHYWVLDASGRSYNEVTAQTWDGETELHYSLGTSGSYDSSSRYSRNDTIQDWENSVLSQSRARLYGNFNSDDPAGDYYYVDFENEKIRVVVLNGFNSSKTNGGLERQIMDTDQIAWIRDDALNFDTPGDWYVLFITHLHPSVNNGAEFYALLDEFIADGGHVLGILHGHQHADTYYTQISGNYEWLVNIIGVDCGFTTNESDIGTKNAYSVSVFTIDTVNKKIYETKIGRGNDREFDFEPVEAISQT